LRVSFVMFLLCKHVRLTCGFNKLMMMMTDDDRMYQKLRLSVPVSWNNWRLNRRHGVENRKFSNPVYLTSRLTGFPWNWETQGIKNGMMGLPYDQKDLRQVQPFRHNSGVWQTDGRTPHDGIYLAMQSVALKKTKFEYCWTFLAPGYAIITTSAIIHAV